MTISVSLIVVLGYISSGLVTETVVIEFECKAKDLTCTLLSKIKEMQHDSVRRATGLDRVLSASHCILPK